MGKKFNINPDIVAMIALAFVNLAVYSRIFGSFLFADDFIQYYSQKWDNLGELLAGIVRSSSVYLFRPVHYLILCIYYKLFYVNVSLNYLLIFFAHLGAAVSVYFFLSEIKKNKRFGLIAALLFTTFLGSWEVVGWTVAIYYPLVVIFLISAIRFHNKGNYLMSSIMFFFALLTHESAVLFVPLVLAYQIIVDNKKLRLDLLKGLYASVFLTCAYLLFYLTRRYYLPVSGMDVQYRLGWHFVNNWLYYISTTFVPLITSYRKASSLSSGVIWAINLLKLSSMIMFVALILYAVKKRIGLVIYFSFWLIISLIPFTFFTTPPVARYLYVASIGMCAIFSFVVCAMLDDRRFRYVGSFVFLLIFAVNLLGMVVIQGVFTGKKEIRREIYAEVKGYKKIIHPKEKLCFVDIPIRDDEIKGMVYLLFGNDDLRISTVNADNVFCERTFDPAIKRQYDRVFYYDCRDKRLKVM